MIRPISVALLLTLAACDRAPRLSIADGRQLCTEWDVILTNDARTNESVKETIRVLDDAHLLVLAPLRVASLTSIRENAAARVEMIRACAPFRGGRR